MVGARASRLSFVSSWKVILRTKLSRLTPLKARAQPLVGRVWLVFGAVGVGEGGHRLPVGEYDGAALVQGPGGDGGAGEST